MLRRSSHGDAEDAEDAERGRGNFHHGVSRRYTEKRFGGKSFILPVVSLGDMRR
jgi:hypothetical protein